MRANGTKRVALVLAAAGLLTFGVRLAADEPAEPRSHTVTIEGNAFHPAELTVDRGEVVVWVNRDFYPHTATDSEERFDSRAIPANGSWTYTADTSGDFQYLCTLHPTMKAVLHVR